jgi:hypothetical protein
VKPVFEKFSQDGATIVFQAMSRKRFVPLYYTSATRTYGSHEGRSICQVQAKILLWKYLNCFRFMQHHF